MKIRITSDELILHPLLAERDKLLRSIARTDIELSITTTEMNSQRRTLMAQLREVQEQIDHLGHPSEKTDVASFADVINETRDAQFGNGAE
jgi:hypothetical protein